MSRPGGGRQTVADPVAEADLAPPGPSTHTVDLHAGWRAWKQICLRSAGFPVSDLDRLASPALCSMDDSLAQLEAAAEQAPEHAVGELEQARTAMAALHAAEEARLSGELVDIASRPRFREAMLWQNRSAAEIVLPRLARADRPRNRKRRVHERLLASYVQRYCAKNDTIGFFGPRCWASIDASIQTLEVEPGASLIARRSVLFENWALDRIARTLSRDPQLRRVLRPVVAGDVRVDSIGAARHGMAVPSMSELEGRALRLCTGDTTAAGIARRLCADGVASSAEEVFTAFGSLATRGLIVYSIGFRADRPGPERRIRSHLRELEPCLARDAALAKLTSIEAARDDVASAAGDPDRLATALERFEQRFRDVTGSSPQRRAGQTYAGRTPLYEEAIRDVRCRVGREIMDRLGRPLALQLQSARWYTHEVAARCRAEMDRVFDDMIGATGGSTVGYLPFCERVAHLFDVGGRAPIFEEVTALLQHKWRSVLGPLPAESRVELVSDALAARAADEFRAPGPGWRAARYHAPDVMIAAHSADELQRGRYQIVLGEIHAARNTLLTPSALSLCDDVARIHAATRADLPEAGLVPMMAPGSDRSSLVPFRHDHELDLGTGPGEAGMVRAADVAVCRRDSRLVLQLPGGEQWFDALDSFYRSLAFLSLTWFKPFGRAPHLPRIVIDGVVVHRESWSFEPEQLPAFATMERVDRFRQVRRWAEHHGIGRRTFYRIDGELKPLYLDLDSPTFVELFCKHLRAGRRVSVSEMFPTPDQCWLADADGNRYTCELRIPVVDPIGAPTTGVPCG